MPACCSGAVPITTGVRPRSDSMRGQLPIAVDRPTLHRPVRRTPGDQQREMLGQGEAGDVGVAPGQIDRLAPVDAGLAKLAELAVDVVRPVAVRIAVGQRAAMGDARPDRPVAPRQELEVAAGAAGGLQVVGAVEPPVDQPAPQPEPSCQVPPFGALVDPDSVEPGRPRQPVGKRRGGQQRDVRVRRGGGGSRRTGRGTG